MQKLEENSSEKNPRFSKISEKFSQNIYTNTYILILNNTKIS